MSINTLLKELEARLPELEWKMSTYKHNFSSKLLPQDLFPKGSDNTPEEIMKHLKQEIQRLASHANYSACNYIAQRIHRKITLLVSCLKPRDIESKINVHPMSLSTRQQFVEDLAQRIQQLKEQYEAIHARLTKTSDPQTILQLKKELGNIEKHLTQIEEQNRFVNISS